MKLTIVDKINFTIAEILEVAGLKLEPSTQSSAHDILVVDMLRPYHRAAIPLLSRLGSQAQQKTYVLILFHASLVVKPWFFDLPEDLTNTPLRGLMTIRQGTVCDPLFMSHETRSYAAFEALLELVSSMNQAGVSATPHSAIRITAAPYLLLRVAHPLKVFLADQPLRGLTPMPMPLQVELITLLKKYICMRCDDSLFQGMVKASTGGNGKTHLKLLQPLILDVKALWNRSLRLGGSGTWQEEGPGKEIEECLTEWEEVATDGWGIVVG